MFVIHHSDCGMQLFTGEVIADLLEDNLETASFDGQHWSNPKHGGGSVAGHFVHWHTFQDNAKSVTEDVARIRSHPLVPKHIPIYGFHLRREDRPAGRGRRGQLRRQTRRLKRHQQGDPRALIPRRTPLAPGAQSL